MRAAWLASVALAGCSFDPTVVITDAPPDVPVDIIDADPNGRITDGLIAVWRFNDGSGAEVADSILSVDPGFDKTPMPLAISPLPNTQWVNGGLELNSRAAATTGLNPHIDRTLIDSGQFTIEVWATPKDDTQGASSYGVLFSLSPNAAYRNASIHQVGDRFVGRVRTSSTTPNGLSPEISTDPGIAGPVPVHLVLVANSTERVLYVNGTRSESTPSAVGSITNWADYFRVSMGDEVNSDHHWEGTLWFAAAYDRALPEADVLKNLAAKHNCNSC